MTAERAFKRSFDALPEIVAFTAESFARQGIDPSLLPVVDFALEELFTNMVKYSRTSNADVRIEVTGIADGVEVSLTDFDVEPFDVTVAPDADTTLPIEARRTFSGWSTGRRALPKSLSALRNRTRRRA